MKCIKKHWKIIATIVVVIIVFALLLSTNFVAEDITKYTKGSLLVSAFLMLVLYVVKTVVMIIPVVSLYAAAGVIFPMGWAIIITYLGLLLELSIGYYVGQTKGVEKVLVKIKKNEKAEKMLSYNAENDHVVCFMARFLPIPFELVSMFFGAYGMPYGRYIVFSLLGLSPYVFPYVIAGNNISSPLSKEFLVPFSICIIISICVIVGLKVWQGRRAKKGGNANE